MPRHQAWSAFGLTGLGETGANWAGIDKLVRPKAP
jgi:hypothetical protein